MATRQRRPRKATVTPAALVNRFRPHPWHGLEVGPNAPRVLNAYIEITPFDVMKYEVDRVSGCLRVDRPQRSSAQHPALYDQIIVRGRVIGGLQMIDGGEADDKIIGVLENDDAWGSARDVKDVPPVLVERLQHYFLTYKLVPGQKARARVGAVYGRAHALDVVRAAMADYADNYPP